MSRIKKILDNLFCFFLMRNKDQIKAKTSLDLGSASDLINKENLLSHDESKALWIKINQTLQIIH